MRWQTNLPQLGLLNPIEQLALLPVKYPLDRGEGQRLDLQ